MTGTVIVVHPGSLGDVLLAVPAIRRLRARYRDCELVLIARADVSRFLEDCEEIDHWISIENQESVELFSRCPEIAGKLQVWLKRCEFAVAWLEDRGRILSDRLKRCGVRKYQIQSPFAPTLSQHHQSHRFLESIGEMPERSEAESTIQVQQDILVQARAYLDSKAVPQKRPLVLIHPGSGSVRKCLSPEVTASLIQRFQQSGLFPVIVEGPADHDVVKRILAMIGGHPVVLKGLELSLLAGILTQSDFYIGHDSGVTHVAAALGVKTLAIFGPTDHRRWAPLGTHVTVIQGLPCTCHSWESVGQCANRACLDIPIENILQEVREHLQSPNDYKPL